MVNRKDKDLISNKKAKRSPKTNNGRESNKFKVCGDPDKQMVEHINIDKLLDEQKRLQEEDLDRKPIVLDIMELNSLNGSAGLNYQRFILRKDLLKAEVVPNSLIPIERLDQYELNLLFQRLRPQELLILLLSNVFPNLQKFNQQYFAQKTYLWFSNTCDSSPRFFPIEDCCDNCSEKVDIKWCIRVKESQSSHFWNLFLEMAPQLKGIQFLSLKCLRLNRFNISEEFLKLAEYFPNLLHLDLTECKGITEPVIKELAEKYGNLEHLILSYTDIKEEMLSFVSLGGYPFESLKTLVMNCTHITGETLYMLPKSIQRIDIRYCPHLILEQMRDFSEVKFENLRYLKIEALFDDKAFAKMCSNFSSLILLELIDSTKAKLLTAEGLAEIGKLSNLKSLKFGANMASIKVPLVAIFEGCPYVKSFTFDARDCDTPKVHRDLAQISNYWPLLERLELIDLKCVNASVIESISKLENLRYLDLTQCVALEDDSLCKCLPHFSKLNYLVLDKCHLLTNRTMEAIIEKAEKMCPKTFSASMIRCDNLLSQYFKAKIYPKNLRLTYSGIKSFRFCTFNGLQTRYGNLESIHEFVEGN